MLFDVLIVVVIAAFATFGFRNGFGMSISKLGGWILAFVAAFFLSDKIEAWLKDHTEWFSDLKKHVLEVCTDFVDKYTASIIDALPEGAAERIDAVSQDVIIKTSDKISSSAFTIFVFIGIIVVVFIVFSVLVFLISRRYRDSVLGGIDGIAGLLFGLIQGFIAVIVLLALLMPIAHVVSPETYGYVLITMEDSTYASLLYENNPLLMFIDGVLPSDFNPQKWIDLGDYAGSNISDKDWGNLL